MLRDLEVQYDKLDKRFREATQKTFTKDLKYQLLIKDRLKQEKTEKIQKLNLELNRLNFMLKKQNARKE